MNYISLVNILVNNFKFREAVPLTSGIGRADISSGEASKIK